MDELLDVIEPGSREQARARTFEALKPLTTRIASCRDDPRQLSSLLEAIRTCVTSCDPEGLRQCLDYVLFPLFIVIESGCRARAVASGSKPSELPIPAAASDSAFELALLCVLSTLERAGSRAFREADLALAFLQRWAAVVSLPRDRTSEEAMEAAVQSLRRVFESSALSPACRKALAAEAHAPLIGHLLASLLALAEGELKTGPRGSRALARSCVTAVNAAIAAVADDPDALTFFVPGLVNGLSAVILTGTGTATDTTPKGALSVPAGGATLAAAFHALTAALTIALGDRSLPESVTTDLERRASSGAAAATSAAPDTSAHVLAALQSLALQSQKNEEDRTASSETSQLQRTQRRPPNPPPPPTDRLRVHRTVEWVEFTADKAATFLRVVTARLLAHPSPTARAALAQGVLSLLQNCTKSLGAIPPCSKCLVEAVLTLAGDEVEDVAAPCRDALGRSTAGGARGGPSPLTPHLAVATTHALTSLLQLPSVLRQSAVDAAIQFCNRTAAAVEVLGPERVVRRFLVDPTTATQVLTALLKSVAFQLEEAGLMLHAGAPTGAHVRLPRMPLGLRYISQPKQFEAAARLARFLGRAAVLVEAESRACPMGAELGSPLSSLVRSLMATYRKVASAVGGKAKETATASQSWQLAAAAVLVVIQEIVHGASDQWQGPFMTGASSQPSPWALLPAPTTATATATPAAAFNPDPLDFSLPDAEPDSLDAFDPTPSFGLGLDDLMRQDESESSAVVAPTPTPAPRGDPTQVLKAAVEQIQQEIFEGKNACAIWALRTALQEDDEQRDPQRLTLQQLGENAALLRSMLECIGVLGGALGPLYASSARLLAPALLPALTRLADGALSVRGSAEAACLCLVSRCGFADLDDLVRRNGDWIVDALCQQLRALDAYPTAPQLLSALLRRANVAADLLPLIAEPLRLSLAGISLLARARHPQHTQAFARSLRELSRGVQDEGRRLFAAAGNRYGDRDQILSMYPATPIVPSSSAAVGAAKNDDDENKASAQEPRSLDDIAAFFSQHRHDHKGRRDAGLGDDPAIFEARSPLDAPAIPTALPGVVVASLWAELDGEERRFRAAGAIAVSVIENVAPLVCSPDLPTALLALDTAVTALHGLQGAADTVKVHAQYRRAIGLRDRELRAFPGEPPQLLPSVHHLWPYLLMALKDARLPVVTAAVDRLPELTHLAGADFMTRRIAKEAWPLLARLVQGGRPIPAPTRPRNLHPPRSSGGGPGALGVLTSARDLQGSEALTDHAAVAAGALRALGGGGGPSSLSSNGRNAPAADAEDDVAPGAQLQIRTAVLRCMEHLASERAHATEELSGPPPPAPFLSSSVHEGNMRKIVGRRPGQDSIRQVVGEMLEATVGFLGRGQPLPLQEQAVRTLQALIPHDEDAAWLLLTDIARADKTVASPEGPPSMGRTAPPLPAPLDAALKSFLEGMRAATDPRHEGPMAVRIPPATAAATRAHVLPPVSALLPPFRSGGLRDRGYASVVESARLGQCGARAVKLLEWMEGGMGVGAKQSSWKSKPPKWVERVILPRADIAAAAISEPGSL